MGTLEKMQAAGLVDDDEVLTGTEETEAELVLDEDDELEAVVAEGEEDEDDGHAGGDPDHQGRVEVPKKTLSQLRRTRREAREQVASKDSELEAMRRELQELKKATLKKPQYVDFASDDAYEAALLEYHALTRDSAPAAQHPRQQAAAQRQAPDFSDDVNAHLDRAEKLGVNLDRFAQADRAVRTVLGDMVTDAIISSVGPGSEKAMLLIGTRPAELAKVQQLLASDPSGLKVVSHLTRMAAKATVKGKTISGAPKPTRTPSGGGALSPSKFAKEEARLEKAGDVQGLVNLRREARKARQAASK